MLTHSGTKTIETERLMLRRFDYFYMNGTYVGRLYFSILRSEYEA